MQKVWRCLEELLSGRGLATPRYRGVPWLCRWTSTATPMELSPLDLCKQLSGSQGRNLCPHTTATLPPWLCERVSCPLRHLPFVDFNSFLVSTSYGEDIQHIRRAVINVDRLISQDFNDQGHRRLGSGHLLVQAERLVRAPCFAQALHVASAPSLWLSLFCTILSSSLSTSTILLECC